MNLSRHSVRLCFMGWSLACFFLGNLVSGSIKGSLIIRTPAERINSVGDVLRHNPIMTPYTLKIGFLERVLQVSNVGLYDTWRKQHLNLSRLG